MVAVPLLMTLPSVTPAADQSPNPRADGPTFHSVSPNVILFHAVVVLSRLSSRYFHSVPVVKA